MLSENYVAMSRRIAAALPPEHQEGVFEHMMRTPYSSVLAVQRNLAAAAAVNIGESPVAAMAAVELDPDILPTFK